MLTIITFVEKGAFNCESVEELNQTANNVESVTTFPKTVTLSNFGGYCDVVSASWDILRRGLEVVDSPSHTGHSTGGLSNLSIFTPPRGMLIY